MVLIRFTTTRMEISVHGHRPAVSGTPGEPDEEATHETQSMFCFAFSLDLISSSARQECVATELLVLRSLQLSFTLGPEVRAGTNLCRRYACFSPTIEGSATSSQSKHWSGDRRVCRTCSAGPAFLLLSLRWIPVCTSLIKYHFKP